MRDANTYLTYPTILLGPFLSDQEQANILHQGLFLDGSLQLYNNSWLTARYINNHKSPQTSTPH